MSEERRDGAWTEAAGNDEVAGAVPDVMITGGTLVDPETGRSEPADLLLSGGQVSRVAAPGQLGRLEMPDRPVQRIGTAVAAGRAVVIDDDQLALGNQLLEEFIEQPHTYFLRKWRKPRPGAARQVVK